MRYDSLGRMVLNVEPNTSGGFEPDPNVEAPLGGALKAWRYVYDNQGTLVGKSDARGCGVHFAYDAAGRLLGEEYSPCEAWHPAYSAATTTGMDGYESTGWWLGERPDRRGRLSPAWYRIGEPMPHGSRSFVTAKISRS
ncbi:MAG: hypothetical protein JW751_00415 [Polyangiaceae bacterium]|nr:hypothetical protein [Polyangiaceae bacterium]